MTEAVHFLYPADVLKPTQVDEMFAEEAQAIRAAGFGVSVVSLESLAFGEVNLGISSRTARLSYTVAGCSLVKSTRPCALP